MKKLISISFVILIILAEPTFGQGWGKTFGGSYSDALNGYRIITRKICARGHYDLCV